MRKNLNKLATLALSGMMVMSMAVPAFAMDVPFKKVLYTDGKTLAPATEFDFSIKPAANGSQWNYTGEDGQPHTATTVPGVAGGVVVKQKAAFAPAEGELGTNVEKDANGKTIGAQFESKAIFEVKENLFNDYGVYEYDLKEIDGEYEGINYSPSEFKLYVYKFRNKQNKDEFVTTIERVKDGKGNAVKVKPTEISNNYGRHTPPDNPDTPPSTPEKPNDSTHNVVIKKNISGSVANKTEKFKFQVKVDPANKTGVTAGKKEMYHVESVGGATLGFGSLTAGAFSSEFEVTQDKGIEIFGLTKGDVVTIKEGSNSYTMTVAADPTQNGYVTGLVSNSADFTGNFNVVKDDAVVIVDNNKGMVTPTGIVMNVAPYAMMLAVAGGLGVVFMNRKKEEE
nr:sortase [uncultured Oribacterium sp.]